MRIVFRLDSSLDIGSGHVMRCLALAQALQNAQTQVTFICRILPGHCYEAIRQAGFEVLELQNQLSISWIMDAHETIECLNSIRHVDWLIVDHYGLGCEWERKLRPYVKHIAVIDDLADRLHDCDLLLDQNHVEKEPNRYEHQVPQSCRIYLGPHYALLRSEFERARLFLKPRNGEASRLLIFLGGNDADNITTFVLKALSRLFFLKLNVTVVVGKANPHREAVKVLCDANHYTYYCGVPHMAELMACSDWAIGAGGISAWERCCMGLPTLVISLAYNQELLINLALSAHVFEYAGPCTQLNEEQFCKQVVAFTSAPHTLKKMSDNGLALVDGLGAFRVAALLQEDRLWT